MRAGYENGKRTWVSLYDVTEQELLKLVPEGTDVSNITDIIMYEVKAQIDANFQDIADRLGEEVTK